MVAYFLVKKKNSSPAVAYRVSITIQERKNVEGISRQMQDVWSKVSVVSLELVCLISPWTPLHPSICQWLSDTELFSQEFHKCWDQHPPWLVSPPDSPPQSPAQTWPRRWILSWRNCQHSPRTGISPDVWEKLVTNLAPLVICLVLAGGQGGHYSVEGEAGGDCVTVSLLQLLLRDWKLH